MRVETRRDGRRRRQPVHRRPSRRRSRRRTSRRSSAIRSSALGGSCEARCESAEAALAAIARGARRRTRTRATGRPPHAADRRRGSCAGDRWRDRRCLATSGASIGQLERACRALRLSYGFARLPKSQSNADLRVSLPRRARFRALLPQDQRRGHRARCPECGKIGDARVSGGAGLVFKGSGFYLTDYGKNAHRKSGSEATPTRGSKIGGESERRAKSASSAKSATRARATEAQIGQRRQRAPSRRRRRPTAPSKPSEQDKGQRQRMDAPDLLRASSTRAAASLGAPDSVDAGSRAPARSVVRRLGDESRDGARETARAEAARARGAIDRADGPRRARGERARRSPGPGFINFRARRRTCSPRACVR